MVPGLLFFVAAVNCIPFVVALHAWLHGIFKEWTPAEGDADSGWYHWDEAGLMALCPLTLMLCIDVPFLFQENWDNSSWYYQYEAD